MFDPTAMLCAFKNWILLAFCILLLDLDRFGFSEEKLGYKEYVMLNSSPQKTLYCPIEQCSYQAFHKQKCCLCEGLTDWEYHNRSIGELSVRLYHHDGFHGEVINKGNHNNLYKLKFNNHLLMSFPEKLCNFKKLIIIELTNNWISEIGDISCLHILDTLNISGNRISEVKAHSFRNNLNLRILDLSNNILMTMSPDVLPPLALSSLILNHNDFRYYDLSNLGFMTRPFCIIDVSNNKLSVETITNKQNLTFEKIKPGAQGYINFQYNELRTFSDYIENFAFKHLREASRLWDYSIDFRNNPLLCDCKLVPLMEMVQPLLKVITVFRDYFNVSCFDPPHLRGRSLYNITKTRDWGNITCPLREINNCPHGCTCYYKISGKHKNFRGVEKTVFVNCTASGLHELPQKIPKGDEYYLFFSRNFISEIIPREYLRYTKVLRLSRNILSKIDSTSVKLMFNISKIILIGNSGLVKIPDNLKLLNPCHISFPKVHLVCTCDNIWLKDWIENNQIVPGKRICNADKFFCKTKTKDIPLTEFDADILLCDRYFDTNVRNILIMSLTLILVSVVSLWTLICLKYEIIILLRKGRVICRQTSLPRWCHEFDIFISFDEQRADIRKWIITTLIPMLQKDGYSLYVPLISLPVGAVRTEETQRIIRKCQCFLVVLSDEYLGDGAIWTAFEWKSVWKRFCSSPNIDMVLVNFDLLERTNISNKQIKALLNLGYAIEFHNQSGDIYEKIRNKLYSVDINGNPNVKIRRNPTSADDWELLEMSENTPLITHANNGEFRSGKLNEK